ncbi:MAG: Ldh family oxidoreductase [Pirellulaceae bacterium]|nr:Ldh family oxidoreductase [Pirellulaceae bacterium]
MPPVSIRPAQLRQFASDLLSSAGVPRGAAEQVADSLVDANLCEHDSHGVQRLLEYVELIRSRDLQPAAEWEELERGPSFLVVDAHRGFGQVQCRRLVARLVEMARANGVAVGAMRECGHVGRLGEWVESAALQGLAAWMSVTDNGTQLCVAHPEGATGLLGTNPVAVAAPTSGPPLVVDMSTSVAASGKVTKHRLAGLDCPRGWLQDAAGAPTTDPAVLQADPPGTLLSLGGFKGFGLATLLDALVGGLSGGHCPDGGESGSMTNNVLMTVIDPDRFAGREHFARQATQLAEFIRRSPARTDEPLAAPGDRSRQRRAANVNDDSIRLDEGVWRALQELADRLKD